MSSSTILRVRELLPQLSYGELVAYNLIPDLVDLLEKEGDPILFKSIRFPKFVYSSAKEGIPHFGVQMEHIVRTYLATPTEGASTAVKVALAQVGLGTTSKADWKAYLSRFGLPGLLRELEQNWKSVPFLRKGGGPAYEVELQEDGVQGHPDIVVETAVLDVKTTTSLKKMLPEACLQILAYFVLGKANGLPFRHAGLVLPMQRRVVTFDLSRWKSWHDYLAILHQTR